MANLIGVKELREMLASEPRPTVVDVRDEADFVAGHIPSAVHIPGDDVADRVGEIPRGQPVVTY